MAIYVLAEMGLVLGKIGQLLVALLIQLQEDS